MKRANKTIKGFWGKLKRPIFCLAPMEDASDAVFRRMVKKYSKRKELVIFTEFVSCEGLLSVGKKMIDHRLIFDKSERPIVVQFFGRNPENFYKCAKLARKLGFDGIDINMGCPDKNVVKQGAGSALIREPKLAKKIIEETKRGAGPLPVSVKTRIGFNANTIETWIRHLLDARPATITIHSRTRKEMSLVPADWNTIAKAVKIAHKMYPNSKDRPLIIGNGDVQNLKDAKVKIDESGADGVMVGRAVFGNPWFFISTSKSDFGDVEVGLQRRLKAMAEHTHFFNKILNKHKNFDSLKKHYKSYASGFEGAKKLRVNLMSCKTTKEAEKIILNFLF